MIKLYVAMERGLLVLGDRQGRWSVESRLEGVRPQCVAVDPRRPDRVYCGTLDDGLWRSEDAGGTWARADSGITHSRVTALAASESNLPGARLWAGTEPSAVFRSRDDGSTWEEMPSLQALPSKPTWSFPPRPYTHHVRWIALDPTDEHRLFVCIELGGVMRSLDGGETWEDRKPSGPLDVHTLRAHPLAPGRLYAAAGDGYGSPGHGYAFSLDGGQSWEYFGVGLSLHYLWGLAVDPGDPDTVLVSAARGPQPAHNPSSAESAVFRKSRGGPWEEVSSGLPERQGTLAAVLATDGATPGVCYAASNRGLFRTADSGQTWQPVIAPWPEAYRGQRAQALAVAGEA